MEYTDTDLLNWWVKLSKLDQLDILEIMIKETDDLEKAKSALQQWRGGLAFSPKQLEYIREFDK